MKTLYLVDTDFYRKHAKLLNEMDHALLDLRLADADSCVATLRAALASHDFAVLSLDDKEWATLVQSAQQARPSLANALYQTHLDPDATQALTEWLATQRHASFPALASADSGHLLLLSF